MFTERQQNILGVLRQHRDGITSDEIAHLRQFVRILRH